MRPAIEPDNRQPLRLSERAKGASHELWAAWQLQRRGVDVIPVGGFASFDLLAVSADGRTLRRVEVKAARARRQPGRYYGEAGRAGVRFDRYAGIPALALPGNKTGVRLTDYWLERWDLIAGALGVGTTTTTTRGGHDGRLGRHDLGHTR